MSCALSSVKASLSSSALGVLVAASPVGKQLVQQWNGNAAPHDGEHQDVDVAGSQHPVGAVQDEPALRAVGEQLQDDSRGVELIERVLVEEALDAPDRGLGLRVTADACCEFGVADIFGLEERADHQDQEVTLVLAVLGEEGDEVQSEGVQDGVGRVPLCHKSTQIFTPRKTVGYCSLGQCSAKCSLN